MKRTNSLCLLLAIAAAPACGDDGDSSPDARVSNIDASTGIDAALADAAATDAAVTDASIPAPDANNLDANVPDARPLDEGIAMARLASDGVTDITVNAVVTYKKAAVGNDLAGFFLQGEPLGPALFIAVDPATLTPEPVVGDYISLRITSMATSFSLRQADQIADLVVNGSGNDVASLVQNVSNTADLVTALVDYESELVDATIVVQSDFFGAGSGFVQGPVDSTAVIGDGNLRLRVPITLQDSLGFVPTCSVTLSGTPVGRFNSAVQLSASAASELTATCPAPVISSALAPSATEFTITFNRDIDATSIVDATTQFVFDNGLTAMSAAVVGSTLTITTSTQTPDQAYNLTIADTVLDVLTGTAGRIVAFSGFNPAESICDDGIDNEVDTYTDCLDTDCAGAVACDFGQLTIWELDPDQSGSDTEEFVELRNLSNAAIDLSEFYVLMINGNGDSIYATYELAGSLAANGLYVLGNAAVVGADQLLPGNGLQNSPDGVLLVQCPTCTDASDFSSATMLTTAATFSTVGGAMVTKVDAVAYGSSNDTGLMGVLGVVTQFTDVTDQSLQRSSLVSFIQATPSPGASGVQP